MLCVHVTACADRWIALKEPVLLQGTNFPKLIMKLRFFFKDPLEITDPLAQRLYFMQVCPPRTDREVRMRRGGGEIPTAPAAAGRGCGVPCTQINAAMIGTESMLPEIDAAQLAALYLQATVGDHEKKRTRTILHG